MAKRALLIGCNYPGTQAALNGCVNDVFRMKSMLVETFGFEEDDITILIDTDDSYESPTGSNIKRRLAEKVEESHPEDVLVFHFSGHGSQVPAPSGEEKDGKDECICPTDLNVLIDDDLRRILKNLKDGVRFTMIADCCHSGTMLDHSEVQIHGNKDPDAPEMPDLGALGQLFGLKEGGGDRGIEVANRSLPTGSLFQMLGSSMGTDVNAGNIHSALGSMFGSDASPMLTHVAGMAGQMLMGQLSGSQGQEGEQPAGGKKGGGLAACLPMLLSLFGLSSKPSGGKPPAQPQPQAPAGGSAYQVPEGHIPGQKPPASEQLPEDKGILVTGCQAHETSADACPSGDKSQAYGALSNAIQAVVRKHKADSPDEPLTNRELVMRVRATLLKTGFS
eukprot:CAMPEP_0177600898 /NCGR_PEP_ID=MMETSP0419_2-20121207/13927_1 /TAXON_ID=582737 /ORGANISM="Tetraselmis sp., Strain GSL018" /LENGTH=390 /DNA_ID=CAMNT_0019094039 /DNA_START=85 /DNA_END=1254 /DNA_ORIENTATION=-